MAKRRTVPSVSLHALMPDLAGISGIDIGRLAQKLIRAIRFMTPQGEKELPIVDLQATSNGGLIANWECGDLCHEVELTVDGFLKCTNIESGTREVVTKKDIPPNEESKQIQSFVNCVRNAAKKVLWLKRARVLQTGQVVDAFVVTSPDSSKITGERLCVDLGGLRAMVHRDELPRFTPMVQLAKGQWIKVRIIKLDIQRGRASVSCRQAEWFERQSQHAVGEIERGTVSRVLSYGAFVQLVSGLEGLVHVSEMTWRKNDPDPFSLLSVGQQVDVFVVGKDTEKQQISLSIKRASADPWLLVPNRFPPGTKVKGIVRKVKKYGAFIEIAPELNGLLHGSEISWTKNGGHCELTPGQEIECLVLAIDNVKRHIALGVKQLEVDPWLSSIPNRYHAGDFVKGRVTKVTNFGIFVELEKDLEGLVHKSEVAEEFGDAWTTQILPGQVAKFRVIGVDPEKRKIQLSMRSVDSGKS
ncbi:MAG: S1 RNA-binding domain-containing protein [Planctomycetes bacterium]|nr:S1 RNA-binding domain-containing protein [Planctomycetota bacterium]